MRTRIRFQNYFKFIVLAFQESGEYIGWISWKRWVLLLSLFFLTEKLLTFSISIVLGICSTVAYNSGSHGSEAQDPGFVPMYGTQGGSVLFHVIKKQEADPVEVSWGFGPQSNYRVLLQVRRGADTPTWVSLQDKYQQRVHVPNVTSLKIENLTPEDSGQYRARASFTGGMELNQVFLLTVYGKWHCLTPPYGFSPAFVLGVSHKPHFSWSLPNTSLHILFSLSELG